ncbi:MAG: hypothetical protein J0H09_15525 [Burkholderiales bacterium]|nr:hypothetical protein [Burkholderiales bacterium]
MAQHDHPPTPAITTFGDQQIATPGHRPSTQRKAHRMKLLGEKFADPIHAGSVIGAAVDVHQLLQQSQHPGKPLLKPGFICRNLVFHADSARNFMKFFNYLCIQK